MLETEQNPWATLLVPNLGEIGSKRVNAQSKNELFFAQDHRRTYMFVFVLGEFLGRNEPISLNGVNVQHGVVHNKPALILSLKNNDDWQIFLKICRDLYEVLELAADADLVDLFYNRLRYWQYFLKRNADNILSKEEQVGLIGELLVFERYILPIYDPAEAISFWVGLDNDVQDFSIGNDRIEVKACSSPSKNEVMISSLEQLYSNECPIYLVVAYLGHSAADVKGAFSLFSLAHRVATKLKEDGILAYEAFTKKISERGLFLDGRYDDSFYVLNFYKGFRVEKSFPKITIDDVPSGITKAKYSINLNLCSAYELAPDDIFTRE